MKKTDQLFVMGDLQIARDVLVIHPNDGYDLGLLSLHNPLKFILAESEDEFLAGRGKAASGTLVLKNECRIATMRMNLAWWKELGKPRQLRLACEQGRLLIGPT